MCDDYMSYSIHYSRCSIEMIYGHRECFFKIAEIDGKMNYLHAALKKEVASYIEKLICDFDIDLCDIEKQVATIYKRKKVRPKYFDPISGATWSGRGKVPRWLIDRD